MAEGRRGSKRLSVTGVLEVATNATKAATKAVKDLVTEERKQEEEDSEFLARNPQWEAELPPIHGVTSPVTDGKAQSTAALLAALGVLPRAAPVTAGEQNWKKAYQAVTRLLIIRKKARRSIVGTGARLEGRSCGFWSPYSQKRLKLFMFLYNQRTEYFILFLICSHLLVFIFQVKMGNMQQRWTEVRNTTLDYLDGIITSLYTIEMVLRILTLGLYKDEHAYLRNPYNRLDVVIVIDSWIHVIVRSVTGRDYFARVAVFRAFRGLLALKHIPFFADVLAIMSAVNQSVAPLVNVFLLTFFMLVFYSLLGTQFLQKTMSSRCLRSKDKKLSYPERFCDAKVKDAYICPTKQSCKKYGNPNWGSTSFDYIYYSLITMFQVISLEGWSLIMYNIKDAEGERANSYFMSMVVIGTYFLTNLFVAGISGVFLRVRAEHQALLKKARTAETSFYKATVMAKLLKEDIIKDDKNMPWYLRLHNKSKRARKSFVRAVTRTQSQVRSALNAGASRMSRIGTRTYSRTMSRSMSSRMGRSYTMGARAATTLSDQCRGIVEHPRFNWGVLLSVTINAVVLSLYKYGMHNDLLYTLYAIEAVMLVVFGLELLLRFLAYGPGSFIDDKMNVLDVVIIAVSAGALISRAYPNISAIRILRWYYLSKKHVEKNPSVVSTCIKSVGSLVGVMFFYIIVIVVISIISMELYSGQYYNFMDGYPRGNHDSMLQTMLLWFSVTTAEQWVNEMWNSMRPGVHYNGIAAVIYIFYFVLTFHIIMNLIIAVLLEKTELTDNEKKSIQRVEHLALIKRMRSRALTRSGSWIVGAVEGVRSGFGSLAYRILSLNVRPARTAQTEHRRRGYENTSSGDTSADSLIPGAVHETAPGLVLGAPPFDTDIGARRSSRSSQILQSSGFPESLGERRGSRTALQDAVLTLAEITKPPQLVKQPSRNLDRSPSKRQSFELSDYTNLERSLSSRERPWYIKEGALFFIGEDSVIKKWSKAVTNSIWWRYFTLIWVTLSIWTVIETRTSGRAIFLHPMFHAFNIAVVAIFAVEMVMKVICQGLILSPDSYLGDLYNALDIMLLAIDILNLCPWKNEKERRAIQGLLALRPFRFICRSKGLRSLMTTLISTLPAIVSVLMFTFMIFLIFATVGIQQFRGLLWSCNDATITHRAYCVGYFYNDVDLLVPRVWSNPAFHFDDIGNALLSMFVCSTFDNWVTNWLYPTMDIVGENLQPVRNNRPINALFFVVFCIAGGFFIVRVFIGVFISEFGRNSGSKLLTERQKLWRDMNRIIQRMKPSLQPRVPRMWVRKKCFYLIRNPLYKGIMVVALLGYSGLLASNNAKQPAFVSNRRQKAHAAITTYFLLECITKFLGDEFRIYKKEYWKHMEAGISIMAASGLMGVKGTVRGYVGRTAYIIRVFCIIPHIPKARIIMRTLFICLPTMGEILGLLSIFLFAFSGVGLNMFDKLKEGSCISPTLNFRSFENAFVTVFQVTTLDNWSCIMADAMTGAPLCSSGSTMDTNDCGYPYAAPVYFVCLVVVASHIFMNLFVAIILDAITFGLVNENSMITPDHLHAYKMLWMDKRFDPDATGFIGLHKLRSFVDALGAPLGRRLNSPIEWIARIEYEVLSFRVPNKGVPFKELLETLTLYKIGPTGLPLSLRIEREKRIQSIYRSGAATKIQAAVRGFLVITRAGGARPGGEQTDDANTSRANDADKPPSEEPKPSQEVRGSAMLVEESVTGTS